MPTMIRWWEALRAPEVAKWQYKYRAAWDATGGRNGGAVRTVWVAGDGKIQLPCRRKRSRVALVLDLGEGIRASQSPNGTGLGNALQVSLEDFSGAVRVLLASATCSV